MPAVRIARIADIEAIAEIERESFADPWRERSFRDLLEAAYVRMLVAEEQERLVGYAVVIVVGAQAELANIAVTPAARRKGIGALLLDQAIGTAAAEGAPEMYLEVRDSNIAARELYHSRAFVEVGRRSRYYRHPVEDAIILRRIGSAPSLGVTDGAAIDPIGAQ